MPYVRYALLVAGVTLFAIATLVPLGSAEDYGFMVYGPSSELFVEMREMAQRSLTSLTLTGLVALAGVACLLAAVWSLPRRPNLPLAAVAAAVIVAFSVLAAIPMSEAHLRFAVWVAGLGLLASLAIAAVASQRAGLGWLAVAGGALLAWPALGLLEDAVTTAHLAVSPMSTSWPEKVSDVLYDMGIQQILLPATTIGGVLLIVLACLHGPVPQPVSPAPPRA